MNKVKYYIAAGSAVLLTVAARAADDTIISDATTSLTTGFGLIKTLVISVVMFGITIGFVKQVKRK